MAQTHIEIKAKIFDVNGDLMTRRREMHPHLNISDGSVQQLRQAPRIYRLVFRRHRYSA